jgi:hypothetical protein
MSNQTTSSVYAYSPALYQWGLALGGALGFGLIFGLQDAYWDGHAFQWRASVLPALLGGAAGYLLGRSLARIKRLKRVMAPWLQSARPVVGMCSFCKDVRLPAEKPDQEDAWEPVEAYLHELTGLEASHGICPDCAAQHYAEALAARDQDTPLWPPNP